MVTTKVTATLNEETVEWLMSEYPDATSQSQAVVLAISDARNLRDLMQASNTYVRDEME